MISHIRWKRVALAAVVLVMLSMLAGGIIRECRESAEEALVRDLNAAYDALAAQPDFIRMRAEEGLLSLTLADGTVLQIPADAALLGRFSRPWPDAFRLIGGWKSGDDVYFITGGAVDDRWGYVLSGDDAIGTQGLMHLRRVLSGGGAWYFSTMAE